MHVLTHCTRLATLGTFDSENDAIGKEGREALKESTWEPRRRRYDKMTQNIVEEKTLAITRSYSELSSCGRMAI